MQLVRLPDTATDANADAATDAATDTGTDSRANVWADSWAHAYANAESNASTYTIPDATADPFTDGAMPGRVPKPHRLRRDPVRQFGPLWGAGELRRAHGPCALLHPREGSARVCAARGAVGGAIHALVIRGAESVYRRLESHWLRPGRSAAADASAHDITAVFLTDDASARRMPWCGRWGVRTHLFVNLNVQGLRGLWGRDCLQYRTDDVGACNVSASADSCSADIPTDAFSNTRTHWRAYSRAHGSTDCFTDSFSNSRPYCSADAGTDVRSGRLRLGQLVRLLELHVDLWRRAHVETSNDW
jgi:hypothetical protein